MKRGRVVERTKHAIVVQRITSTPGGARLRLYGCLLKRDRVYRLADLPEVDATPYIKDVQIGGRFAAYSSVSGNFDPSTGIAVYDLRTGSRIFGVGMDSGRGRGSLGDFLLKSNGSIAWELLDTYGTVDRSPGTYLFVNDAGGQRELENRLGELGSLALSANGNWIYWTSQEGPRSAPIN